MLIALLLCLFMPLCAAEEAEEAFSLPEGFCYVHDVIDDVILDIRYAGEHNFVGEKIDGYEASYAIMTCEAAQALKEAADIFRGMGYPILPDCAVTRSQWEKDQDAVMDTIEKALPYPVFTKPAYLGSSIGVSRAGDRKELKEALELAFSYDRRVLVEEGLDQPIEVNCSVLGFDGDVKASVLEMPNSGAAFLDFSEKYLAGTGSKGMASLKRIVPAPIGEELTKELQSLSCRIFNDMDCKGVVRIDYMLDRHSDKYYITEINTIPGSLAFYLWAETGLNYPSLIDEMVKCAMKAHEEKHKNNFAFTSDILSGVSFGGAKGSKLGGVKGGKLG